ncbi:Hsp20/alpha crystallin family protein [Edaphocola aurantiacus]|uniref:Hsp20/alpha crystallin family protein n=1 Tax=Edaphocola aurantiacus TaxID=2601682 RepID=UPI001C98A386|nr:Hsp20/alpha crystallin family protein [Edaphocola aurantiacus]
MKTVNANPVKNFGELIDSMFDGRFNNVFRDDHGQATMQPPVNISEQDNSFYIEVMAAGVAKEDIKLNVVDNMLTISYEKHEPAKDTTGKLLRSEFGIRSFKRSFTLGEKVDATKINASYENGILRIALPKKEPVKPAQIEISIQ